MATKMSCCGVILFLLCTWFGATLAQTTEERCADMISKVSKLKIAIEGMCHTTNTTSTPPAPQQYYSTFNWTSVPNIFMGRVYFNHAGTVSFTIPSVIPSSAREVLFYVRMWNDGAPRAGDLDVKIFTQIGTTRYEKYMLVTFNRYNAISISTDNMWFPMPPTRILLVNVPSVRTNSGEIYISAIGYR